MRLAARLVTEAVACQFPDVIPFAVDVSPDQVLSTVVIQEELSILWSRMIRSTYIQSARIAEFSVNVVSDADYLPVILHRDEQGQVHHNLSVDDGRARSPVIDAAFSPCLHRILLSVTVGVVR